MPIPALIGPLAAITSSHGTLPIAPLPPPPVVSGGAGSAVGAAAATPWLLLAGAVIAGGYLGWQLAEWQARRDHERLRELTRRDPKELATQWTANQRWMEHCATRGRTTGDCLHAVPHKNSPHFRKAVAEAAHQREERLRLTPQERSALLLYLQELTTPRSSDPDLPLAADQVIPAGSEVVRLESDRHRDRIGTDANGNLQALDRFLATNPLQRDPRQPTLVRAAPPIMNSAEGREGPRRRFSDGPGDGMVAMPAIEIPLSKLRRLAPGDVLTIGGDSRDGVYVVGAKPTHAQIERRKSDAIYLVRAKTAGVILQGIHRFGRGERIIRLQIDKPAEISAGDTIQIGTATLQVPFDLSDTQERRTDEDAEPTLAVESRDDPPITTTRGPRRHVRAKIETKLLFPYFTFSESVQRLGDGPDGEKITGNIDEKIIPPSTTRERSPIANRRPDGTYEWFPPAPTGSQEGSTFYSIAHVFTHWRDDCLILMVADLDHGITVYPRGNGEVALQVGGKRGIGSEHTLEDGDVIRIGEVTMTFHTPARTADELHRREAGRPPPRRSR